MFKKLSFAGAALAMSTVAMASTADAQRYYPRYEQGYDARYDQGYSRGYDGYRSYDGRRYSHRYNYDRRCSNGTTGTIVGAIAGGLLGRAIDTGGDRSLGTVLGGVGGAFAGRAIERSNNGYRCR